MDQEKVIRLSLVDALYHAAQRYERDPSFREIPIPHLKHHNDYRPDAVAASLRESARRIEAVHAEGTARLRR